LETEVADPIPKAGPSKPKKAKKNYTIRDVLKELYRPLIDDAIPYKSSDAEYLGSYQKAVTTVWNNMSEEDADVVEAILEQWNKDGAPSPVQLK